MFKRLSAALLALALVVAPARADAPYSTLALQNWINQAIFPNTFGAVTPLAVNQLLQGFIASTCMLDTAADCVLPPGVALANLGYTTGFQAGANITFTGTFPNITISATGGGAGTPGGSSGQVQFNNAGAFGGFTVSGDGTLNTSTGALTITKTNGASFGTFATQNYASPPAIGGTTPAAAAFSTLSASGAVSGAGFSAYLGSPPAIGGTSPAAGTFSTVTDAALSSAGMVTNTSGGALGTVAYASASDVQAGTSTTEPVTPSALAGSQAFVSLTYGSTTTWNLQSGYNQTVTLTGNISTLTLSNPTAGQTYTLLLVQDSTGSRTVSWPASFDWGAAGTPTLTTTASKVDMVTFTCINTSGPLFYASVNKGY